MSPFIDDLLVALAAADPAHTDFPASRERPEDGQRGGLRRCRVGVGDDPVADRTVYPAAFSRDVTGQGYPEPTVQECLVQLEIDRVHRVVGVHEGTERRFVDCVDDRSPALEAELAEEHVELVCVRAAVGNPADGTVLHVEGVFGGEFYPPRLERVEVEFGVEAVGIAMGEIDRGLVKNVGRAGVGAVVPVNGVAGMSVGTLQCQDVPEKGEAEHDAVAGRGDQVRIADGIMPGVGPADGSGDGVIRDVVELMPVVQSHGETSAAV